MFLAGVATHGINPNLRKKIPYDPLKDLDAVSQIAAAPLLVMVHPSLPIRSAKELVALAKARPGQINYASNGAGGSSHLAVELFSMMSSAKMTHIPYKGLSSALIDLLPGAVEWIRTTDLLITGHVIYLLRPSSISATISGGNIGVRAMRTPNGVSASSIAEMIAGAVGITPASPTPLIPSGFNAVKDS